MLLVAGAGGGGYALGRASGEDLERARASGQAQGQKAGAARGAERGYRVGLAKGKKTGYRAGYRTERKRVLRGGQSKVAAAPVNRSCGNLVEDGAGTYNVSSVDVVCDLAKQVARQWEMQCANQPSGSCTVGLDFSCSYSRPGYELGSISCTNADRRVSFETGA